MFICSHVNMFLSILQHDFDSSHRDILLIGHSTGCQDALFYMRHGEHRSDVRGVVLQAPVSDREYLASLPDTAKWLELAKQMIREEKSEQLMPREVNNIILAISGDKL